MENGKCGLNWVGFDGVRGLIGCAILAVRRAPENGIPPTRVLVHKKRFSRIPVDIEPPRGNATLVFVLWRRPLLPGEAKNSLWSQRERVTSPGLAERGQKLKSELLSLSLSPSPCPLLLPFPGTGSKIATRRKPRPHRCQRSHFSALHCPQPFHEKQDLPYSCMCSSNGPVSVRGLCVCLIARVVHPSVSAGFRAVHKSRNGIRTGCSRGTGGYGRDTGARNTSGSKAWRYRRQARERVVSPNSKEQSNPKTPLKPIAFIQRTTSPSS